MSHVTPRGDKFYYLEVWDKQSLREVKICDLLGGEFDIKPKPKYVAGSQKRLEVQEDIHHALFWKSIETPRLRIFLLNQLDNIKDEYTFVIKHLTREAFIDVIPPTERDLYIYGRWKKNLKLRDSEISYLKKMKENEIYD